MLSNYNSEIALQGKKMRTFLLLGIHADVNYKSFIKNSFLKKQDLKNKIKQHALHYLHK